MILRNSHWGLRLGVVLLALPVCAPAARAADAGSTAFQFKPQTPLSWTEQSVSRRSVIAPAVDPVEDEITVETRYTVVTDGDGYKVTAAPVSFVLKRAGKVETDALTQIVQTTPVTYRLDSTGRLLKIEGYEKLLETVSRVAPKEMEKVLPSLFGEKTLVEKETAVWRGRLGDALGKPVEKNAGWITDALSPLPDGSQARYYIATVVTGEQEKDGHRLVTQKFLFTADMSRLQSQANDLVRDVVKFANRPRPLTPLPGFSVSGHGERLVDPETMVVHSEKYSRNVQIVIMGARGQQTPVLIQESRESRLTKPPSGSGGQ